MKNSLSKMFFSEEWTNYLIFIAISVIYYIYYVKSICKKPTLYCKKDSHFSQLYTKFSQAFEEPYCPTFWCTEARLQSILRIFFKMKEEVSFDRTLLTLQDGGLVSLDINENQFSAQYPDPRSRPTIILLPGLTGCSASGYMRQLVKQVILLGYRVVVFNQRGQGGIELKTPHTYCATSFHDLKEVVSYVRQHNPDAPLMASGVSLGGMILFHYLAEMGASCPLDAAMVISTVWDPVHSCGSLESPINKMFLNIPLCSLLRQCVARNKEVLNKKFDLDSVLHCSTIREFDTLLTAPMFGYRDVYEYYASAGLTPRLKDVKVPTLALAAKDDPFAPEATLPMKECQESDHVMLLATEKGGHIGFMEGFLPIGKPMMMMKLTKTREA